MAELRRVTRRQKEVLSSAGIEDVKALDYEQAQQLIQNLVDCQKLPRNVMSPATLRQITYLDKLGVEHPSDLTREEASDLLSRKISQAQPTLPVTQKQLDFIASLGGMPHRSMNQYEATQFIDYLLENGGHCPHCGTENDCRHSQCPKCGAALPQCDIIEPPLEIYVPKAPPNSLMGFLLSLLDFKKPS